MNKAELLIEYAKAINNLDTSYLKDILSDDFEYISQWVFETMVGKDNYLNYLSGKFQTIKNRLEIPTAEIAYFEYCYGNLDEPCVVITQKTSTGVYIASLIIEVENGLIKKGQLIGVPHSDYAFKFDIHPK